MPGPSRLGTAASLARLPVRLLANAPDANLYYRMASSIAMKKYNLFPPIAVSSEVNGEKIKKLVPAG